MAIDRPRRRFGIWDLGFLIFSSFFLLALLFLWPLVLHPNFVPFPPRAPYSDLLITHLPNAAYIRDALARYGQWPLWNAQILAGQPFAADPLAGLWYPPDLLLLTPGVPLPLVFNLLFALHLAWAGYGLFCFLRHTGLSAPPAFLGGVAFAGTPKLIAHLGAGHVSLVFAVAWTPWLLLAVRRAVVEGGLRRGALAGLCLALIFLADVRWAFYAAVLGAAFWISALPPFAPRRDAARRAGLPAAFAFALIFLSLSAILAIPLGQFILHSSRRALTLADAAAFSLPPFYLIGLLIPDLGGFHEWMTYVGVIPLLLAFLGIRRRPVFWIVAILLAAAFSLGSNFSFFPILFRWLPGLGFLRVPPRAWFIVALGICILAAHGAQVLIEEIVPHLARRYSRISPPPYSHTLIPPHRFFLPALVIFTLADLLRVDSTLFEARPLPPHAPAAEWIAAQPGLFRVYSPSYSLPAGDGLQHVDGIDPLQLAEAVKFIEAASGVHAHGYSVTVPAFETRATSASGTNAVEVATANADAIPDARRLGLLNVKYVAAEFPLDVPELRWVQTPAGGRTRVYENTLVRPRAWMADEPDLPQGNRPEDRSRSTAEDDRAEVVEWSPNRIRVRAVGPGLLVLSEVVYPGWEARVDGVMTPIEPVQELLRGVRVGEGKHEVVFEFRPRALYLGAAITALGLIALAGIWGWGG